MKKFVPLLIIFVSIILSCTGNIPNQSINNIKTFELKSNTCDGTYKVELYDIDDAMIVYVNDNFVTNHGYGRELTSTDISEYIKHGTNNVEFILFDYGANAYAYGVRLLKDDIILYEDHHLANGWGGTYGDPIPHIPYRYIHTFEANCPPTPTPTPTPDECDCNSTSFRIMASGPTCYDKCNEPIFPKDNINNPCKSNTGNTAIVSVYDFDQNGPDLTFVLAPYNKFPIKNDNFKIDYNKALSNLQDSLQVEGASKTGQKDGLIKDEALFSTYPYNEPIILDR